MLECIISYGHKDLDISPVRHKARKSFEVGKFVSVVEKNYRRVLFGNVIGQIVPDRHLVRLDDKRIRAAAICISTQGLYAKPGLPASRAPVHQDGLISFERSEQLIDLFISAKQIDFQSRGEAVLFNRGFEFVQGHDLPGAHLDTQMLSRKILVPSGQQARHFVWTHKIDTIVDSS